MIAKKIMIFILIFCILVVLKETTELITKFITSDYKNVGIGRQITFALAFSYIMTIIFTGFSLV